MSGPHRGPEVLNLVHVSEPVAVDGQLLVDVSAAGVNLADASRVAGSYRPAPELPVCPRHRGGRADR
jgi:NADPH2:quinone reductase